MTDSAVGLGRVSQNIPPTTTHFKNPQINHITITHTQKNQGITRPKEVI